MSIYDVKMSTDLTDLTFWARGNSKKYSSDLTDLTFSPRGNSELT